MTTTYTLFDKSADFGTRGNEGYRLDATTDQAARKEAKRLAKEHNIDIAASDIGIKFFRSEDHCRGEIDA